MVDDGLGGWTDGHEGNGVRRFQTGVTRRRNELLIFQKRRLLKHVSLKTKSEEGFLTICLFSRIFFFFFFFQFSILPSSFILPLLPSYFLFILRRLSFLC